MTLASYSSSAFTTATGIAVAAAAAVEVRREDTGVLATIYSDEAGTAAIAQPGFVADANGKFEFYAAGLDRGYRVTVTKGAESSVHNHAAVGTLAQRDAVDFVPATVDSDISSGKAFKSWLRIDGTVTPATVTVDTNDYNPTNLAVASCLRVTTDIMRVFTGLQGGASGRVIVWMNASATIQQTLWNEHAGSTAANRFSIGGTVVLNPGDSITLYYDSTLQRWRSISPTMLRGHGRCRLDKSGANLVLSQRDGNTIVINGRVETIPDIGPTLAPPTNTVTVTIATPAVATFNNHGLSAGQPITFVTSGALPTGITAAQVYYVIAAGLTANTFQFSTTQGGAATNTSGTQSGTHTLTGPVHYIYAYINAGIMTLEAQLVAAAPHLTQAGTGVEMKSGDATRTLVGMAKAFQNAWTDSATQLWTLSYFNRRRKVGTASNTATRTTTSTTFLELNAEMRVEWLSWANEPSRFEIHGSANNNTASGQTWVSPGIDSVTVPSEGGCFAQFSAGDLSFQNLYAANESVLSEGSHFGALLCHSTAGQAGGVAWNSNNPGERTSTRAVTMG